MAGVLTRIIKRIERNVNSRQAYKFFLRDWQSLGDLRGCAAVLSTQRFTRTLEPLEMSAPRGKRIAVIAPHPDDEMLGAGGTLMHALRGGAAVRCVYITSSHPPAQVEAEAAEVARRVGYRTQFLRFPVHAIPLTGESIDALATALTAEPVDTLFLPFLLDDHEDHRRSNQLLWEAWRRGLIDDSMEVWGYQVYSPVLPNVVVDISDVAEAKASVVRQWTSQMSRRRLDHYILGFNAFNMRLLPKADYVEAFFVVPAREYFELCQTYFNDPAAAFLNPIYKTASTISNVQLTSAV